MISGVIRIKTSGNINHFRFPFRQSSGSRCGTMLMYTVSPYNKTDNSLLSKRRHSVWPTSCNMLWSFYVSKGILDTLSVQFVGWKIAMELILMSMILLLWGWLSWSRTPSQGIHTAENEKVVNVTQSGTRYVFNWPERRKQVAPKRPNHSPFPHPENSPKHQKPDC